MSITTKIQWCDSTCNPTMGCEGCELWNIKTGERSCYAGQLHLRYGGATKGYSPTFEEVTFWRGRMAEAAKWADLAAKPRKDKPWLDELPRLIFVSDMSDALSAVVPFEFLEQEVIQNVTSEQGQRHQWLWLTKRPDRMAQFSELLLEKGIRWPSNLWAGTSITTQGSTSRIRHLLCVGHEQTIRFLSVEPQRAAIEFGEWLPQLNWVIQGGESGRDATAFHLEWAEGLIQQCQQAGVPYFLKQLGSNVLLNGKRIRFSDSHAGDWSEWPRMVRLRQMPKITAHEDAPVRPCESTDERTIIASIIINGAKTAERKKNGRQAALKAWETRRKNGERKRTRSEAAKKAWVTRRAKNVK